MPFSCQCNSIPPRPPSTLLLCRLQESTLLSSVDNCLDCKAGFYTPLEVASTECLPCVAGTYATRRSTSCGICPLAPTLSRASARELCPQGGTVIPRGVAGELEENGHNDDPHLSSDVSNAQCSLLPLLHLPTLVDVRTVLRALTRHRKGVTCSTARWTMHWCSRFKGL